MSAETDAVVAKIANVGQARAALVACIEKLRKGMDLIDQTDAIDIAAGVTSAALSTLANKADFCVRIVDGMAAYDDSAGLSELDRKKIRLAFSQAEETIKLVADLTRSPGFAGEFMQALDLVLTEVVQRVAQAALPLWPLWTIVAVAVGGYFYLRGKVFA